MKSFSTLCLRTVLVSVVSLGITYHAANAQSPTAQTGEFSTSAQMRVMTLDECLKLAVGENLDVKNAVALAQDAAALTRTAFGQYLPSASVNLGYNRTLTA